MKQLLEESKQKLLIPLGSAKRRLVIILNILYCILAPLFLTMEKITSGVFVHDPLMWLVYGSAILLNALSAIYHFRVVTISKNDSVKRVNNDKGFIIRNQEKIDSFFRHASIIPILVMSIFNMVGIGNPSDDEILTDFALAHSLMIVVVLIVGRNAVIIWFVIIVTILLWNVSRRGWDYQYHYSTPTEVVKYEQALDNNEPWALQRQAELQANKLNPPKITRYFNAWIIFILTSFFVSYIFSGITIDILKIVPSVVSDIEKASEQSKRMELEAIENERNRIAYDLHDEVIGTLTTAIIEIDVILLQKGTVSYQANEILNNMTAKLNTSVESLREIVYGLSSKTFLGQDFNFIISDLCSRYDSIRGIKINFRANNQTFELTSNQKQQLFRIIQELLTNSIKHSNAGMINVYIVWSLDSVELKYADNGKGFQAYIDSSKNLTYGLNGITSRAQSIEARYEFLTPAIGMGFFLILSHKI